MNYSYSPGGCCIGCGGGTSSEQRLRIVPGVEPFLCSHCTERLRHKRSDVIDALTEILRR